MTTMRRLVADRWEIVRLLPHAGRPTVAVLAVIHLALGVTPVAFVVGTSLVLGRVPAAVTAGPNSAAWDALTTAFIVSAAVFVTQQILSPLATALGELVARRVDGLMHHELMSSAMSTSGVAPLEDQTVVGQLRVAAAELEFGVQSPGQACAGLLALMARYTQLAGYAIVIGVAFSWLATAGLVLVVLLFRHGQSGGMRRYAQARRELEPAERKVDYLRRLAIQAPAAKEIRVFGLAGWLTEFLRRATLDFLTPVWAARRRVYLWPFLRYATFGLMLAAAVLATFGLTAADTLTLTSFALVVQAAIGALRLSEYYPEADLQIATGMVARKAMQEFAASMAAAEPPASEPPAPAEPPASEPPAPPFYRGPARRVPEPAHTIHFDNVTFRYPGREQPVFDRLNLTIPVGRCTAIVGVNGAGKTTLIKLLARLYEPTGGAIRVDGVDIRTYPVDAWRAKLGVIFQDFVRHEASTTDNVGFGAVEHSADWAGIQRAVAAVGMHKYLGNLRHGLQTPLARHMDGGVDLSGGQWQRVALARVLFALRHGAPILVLDEPTASLDVRAELSFFQEFAELAEGATTLLISHRFATVRHADLIVVLEHGQVLEQGSHDGLLAANGRYAQLFRLQAERVAGPGGMAEVPA